jgi:hypothetical protein
VLCNGIRQDLYCATLQVPTFAVTSDMRRSSLLALREAPPGLPPRKPLPAPGLPMCSPVALPAGLLGCVWCGSVARGSSSAMHTSSAWIADHETSLQLTLALYSRALLPQMVCQPQGCNTSYQG